MLRNVSAIALNWQCLSALPTLESWSSALRSRRNKPPRLTLHLVKAYSSPSITSITSHVLSQPLGLKCHCQEGYDFLADLDLEMVAELKEWGAVKWDHLFGTSSFPCLSLIARRTTEYCVPLKRYWHCEHDYHVVLLPDGVMLMKYMGIEVDGVFIDYQIAEAQFQPCKSQPASIEISWTGVISCARGGSDSFFEWNAWKRQPKPAAILPLLPLGDLGDRNDRLNVAELREAWCGVDQESFAGRRRKMLLGQ